MATIFRSFVLSLVAQAQGTLNAAAGELAHAAFYAAIDTADPDLARRMHDAQERAGFTLSPFRGYRRSPDGQTIHVGEGQQGWLRVTLLDDDLSAVLFRFLQRQPLTLRLGDPFAVQELPRWARKAAIPGQAIPPSTTSGPSTKRQVHGR